MTKPNTQTGIRLLLAVVIVSAVGCSTTGHNLQHPFYSMMPKASIESAEIEDAHEPYAVNPLIVPFQTARFEDGQHQQSEASISSPSVL